MYARIWYEIHDRSMLGFVMIMPCYILRCMLVCVWVYNMLGFVLLNPIVWCYLWHYVWFNVVINKIVLLLSKIMVTWIFGHYYIVHKMHNMWFCHRRYKSQVFCKFRILVRSRWWNWTFYLQRLNISTRMICLDYGSGDF